MNSKPLSMAGNVDVGSYSCCNCLSVNKVKNDAEQCCSEQLYDGQFTKVSMCAIGDIAECLFSGLAGGMIKHKRC